MQQPPHHVSANTVVVLEMVAAGNSYEQILAAHPRLTYLDIFAAAAEALRMILPPPSKPADRLAELHTRYPRAYEKWTTGEETRLRQFIANGLTVAQIAHRLERQRSAIRSRIVRLNLVTQLPAREQARLNRIIKLDPVNADPADQSVE